MIVLIPLGGIGDRFKKLGYKEPKALIPLFGKPILYYLLDSLNLKDIEFVYIPYNKEYSNYRFEDKLMKDYPNINFKFLELTQNTNGAAETINISLKKINYPDCSILCLDADNFYSIDIIKLWNGENIVFTFNDNNTSPIYSYVKTENNKIIDIVEKEKISNYACTGAYGFSSYLNLLSYSQKVLDNEIKQKGEYYTSNVIKEMIIDFIPFYNYEIKYEKWHCLGTPIQLRQFYNNYPLISCLNNNSKIIKKRICFDFDNTLVSFPKIKNDYTTVLPIQKNIDFLKYLKKFDHTIIIYTARRMNTHNGNIGKILCDIGKITFETLEKFCIPFDEIYFGKPYADYYIDDLAVNCFEDIEKSTGFYMDNISPRDFNTLEYEHIDTIIKKSNDLSGEIYYYNNIIKSIKDLFPLFIDYDINNQWYKVEKINGVSVSTLFLSELLTIDCLQNIINSIERIHKTFINDNENININIYDNYCNKLKQRYERYDYSKFEKSEEVYKEIYEELKNYETLQNGKKMVIHGDAVMTNIMINNFDKIKFIDMRGKLGNDLTIYGDWLYDWAKLYQSLIGYDKILLDKQISDDYEKKNIQYFENYFINTYSLDDFKNLITITKSLLFTLIPLHDNEKCIKYYNLIFKLQQNKLL